MTMESSESYYLIRLTRSLRTTKPTALKPDFTRYAGNKDGYDRRRYTLASEIVNAQRFGSLSEAKRALKRACVRDVLNQTSCREWLKKDDPAIKLNFGHRAWRMIPVTWRVEIVRVTRTVHYHMTTELARPEFHPLERLAMEAPSEPVPQSLRCG